MKHFRSMSLVAALALTMSACGPKDQVVPTTPPATAIAGPNESLEGLKHRISSISQTGDAGSALEGVDEGIEKFVTDPGKKDALLKDLRELNSSVDNEKNKKIAAKMLSNL